MSFDINWRKSHKKEGAIGPFHDLSNRHRTAFIMNITITEIAYEDKKILWNLLQLYKHDFSEYHKNEIGSDGEYSYKYFERYWTEDSRHPYLIYVDGNIAGFVLINLNHFDGSKAVHYIPEFFILRKYRRLGIGSYAATYMLDLYKGNWEVSQDTRNKDSLDFWDKVIGKYTKENYTIVMRPENNKRILIFKNAD